MFTIDILAFVEPWHKDLYSSIEEISVKCL